MTVSTTHKANGVRTANPSTTSTLRETSETPGSARVSVFNALKMDTFKSVPMQKGCCKVLLGAMLHDK